MKEENKMKLVRWGIGCGLLVLHAITKVNGNVVLAALICLGVPWELAKRKNASHETN